jgi:replicative DNA helicase
MSAAPLRVSKGGKADEAPRAVGPLWSEPGERGLLSAIMVCPDPSAAAVAKQVGVKHSSFYVPAHSAVYEVIDLIATGGGIPSAEAVGLHLQTSGKLEQIGGWDGFLRMSAAEQTTLRVREYAEIVKLLWERRFAIYLAKTFIEAVEGASQRDEFVKASGSLGNRLVMLGRVQDTRSLTERVDDVLADVKARSEGKEDRSKWLPTGMDRFDKICQPFGSSKEDHFIGVAGGSGQGKSAIMRQWGHHWNRLGKRVLVYTRETSIDGWIEQAAAQAVGVDLMHLAEAPRDKLREFEEELTWLRDHAVNKLLFIYENDNSTPLLYVEELVAHYRSFEHLHGQPDAVIIDYLQILMPDPKKRCGSREQEVAYVSHTLQGECRRAGNVWIVGAQMNESGLAAQRTAKKDEQGRLIHRTPIAGDLRESQAFYHDADRMLCIYRPPEDCNGNDQATQPPMRPEQWICQIKRRRGGTGAVKCWFARRFTRFEEFNRDQLLAAENVVPSPKVTAETGPRSKAEWKAKKAAQQGGTPF